MKALLIGESWGINERQGQYFVGRSGQELARMGGESGLFPPFLVECKFCHKSVPFAHCSNCKQFNGVNLLQMVKFWAQTRNYGVGITNVFHEHPYKDNEQLFFGGRLDDVCLDLPAFQAGNKKLYLLKSNRFHLEALEEEIASLQPNILIPLGNTACWAVLQQTGIKKLRGILTPTRFGIKAVPTFHPAALRDWSLRSDIISDLRKAFQESKTSTIIRPKAWILTNPTLDEIQSWFAIPANRLSCDIESGTVLFSKSETTRMKKISPKAFNILARLISMVGFGRSESQGLVIPFVKRREDNGTLESYWPNKWQEVRAWEWVQHGLSSGAELITQNGMYDYNRLLCSGMRPRNMKHDTMLGWHDRMPEKLKGLGYLDSILRNDSSWKTAYGNESLKRDD
jgi:uracil-DNA glycosylase